MTRYTKYKKRFNTTTLEEEEQLTYQEKQQIEEDKEQTLETVQASKSMRSKPACLKCRKRGHSVKFCPQGVESNICYNCGSREHTLKNCRKPKTDKLAFASCFICKETGHLASQCQKNEHGIYPRGGGCRFCGSNKHLARDCRPTKDSEAPIMAASSNPKMENPDEDLVFSALKNIQDEKVENRKRRLTEKGQDKDRKLVKFK